MDGDQPRIGVVAAPGRIADLEIDALALIELLGGLREALSTDTQRSGENDRGEARVMKDAHVVFSFCLDLMARSDRVGPARLVPAAHANRPR